MNSCPADLLLAACATGQASDDDHRKIAAHIDVCTECRGVLAAFVLAGDDAPDTSTGTDDEAAKILDADARYQQTADAPLGRGGRGAVYAAVDRELERPVAIKVLWGSRGLGAGVRGQLLTEARALGRVAHPNIVALYDVHEWRETTVLVMERVSGSDLRTWATARPRTVPEIAAVFVQVARGLGAAHDAGIVHCDVKPENILVGEDGRVRLTDFGLARHLAPVAGDDLGVPAFATTPSRHTGRGGTPAYVAPELLAGDLPSPASDQFSFAVTLYECLHGARPFPGGTATEVMEAVRDDRRAPTPPRRLSGRLRDLVERCLSRVPGQRYPSLRPVAEELGRIAAPRHRRTAAVALGLVLVTAMASLAVARRDRPADDCPPPAVSVDAVWGPAAQASLAARFASGARDDVYLHARLLAAFHAFAERWRDARSACPGTADAALQSRITTCLARGPTQVRALLTLISTTDTKAVNAAPSARRWRDRVLFAVHALPDPQRCIAEQDRVARTDASAPADDVERVVRAQAETDLGDYAASAVTATEVATRLPLDSHPGLRAESLMIAGVARGRLDQDAEAERVLLAAVDAATRARDDDLIARAFLNLVGLIGTTKPREAGQILELAEAAVVRAGKTPRLESSLLMERAKIERQTDQLALAVEHLTRAVALRESLVGPTDLDLAVPVGNLANATMGLGRIHEGLELQKRALGILERHLPENHPEMARIAHNAAAAALLLGRMSEAEAGMRRALAIREAIFGPDHVKVAESLEGLSEVLRQNGRATEGVPLAERALAIRQRTLPADHVFVAYSHANLAVILIEQGRCAAASPHLQFAIDRFTAAQSPLEFLTPATLARVRCLCRDGHAPEGRAAAGSMLARIESALDPQHRLAADTLLEIGLCDLAERRASAAEPSLRRAIAILEHAGLDPNRVAEVRWPLARALWQLGRREEAKAAADDSQRAFRAIAHPVADRIARWLADPDHPQAAD